MPFPLASTAASQRSGSRRWRVAYLTPARVSLPCAPGPIAGVVLVAPIGEVVAALGAGAGVVRDLVGRQASGGESVLRRLEQRRGALLVGHDEITASRRSGECGAGFDGQLVERQMLASEREGLVELAPPSVDALAGAGVDQVEREPGKSGGGLLDRGDRLGAVVRPAEKAQGRRIERLHAERQPVDPGRGKRAEAAGLGRIRVGLEGNFDIRQHRPMPAHPVEQRRDCLGRHQRGRAAAEEYGAHFAPRHKRGLMVEIGKQCPRPTRLIDRVSDMAVEIAIRAFRAAERPMDVDRQRLVFGGLSHRGNRPRRVWQRRGRGG